MEKKKAAANMAATYPTMIYNPPHVPDTDTMRDYQVECLKKIEEAGPGSHLCVLATGLGKTYIFSHLPRHGRVLLLSHRDELVHQPEKYYDCSFGVEQASEHSDGEEVVSASVQSIIRRLSDFDPYDFDMIITDEAHHATASTYKKVYDYFKPRVHLGFTATPDRCDKKDLNEIYEDVIFTRDIRFGIKRGYLCDVECIRVDVGMDLRKIKKTMGDFNQKELGDEANRAPVVHAIAEAYYKYAKGQTMIFATNVQHAQNIAALIEGAVVVTGDTKDRDEIIKDFSDKKIPCLVNCMVFTEGTDIPCIETVIMARPTASQTIYVQSVGRGLRLYPGKSHLRLIDCVGVSRIPLCSAPTLFGLNLDAVPAEKHGEITGMLTKLESVINEVIDTPQSWIKNAEMVSIFGEENDISFRGLNFILLPDESFRCNIGNNQTIIIPPTNALGKTSPVLVKNTKAGQEIIGRMKECGLQEAIDIIHQYLNRMETQSKSLWDADISGNWGAQKVTSKQITFIKNLMEECGREYDKSINSMTKYQASIIIDRLTYEKDNLSEEKKLEIKQKKEEKEKERQAEKEAKNQLKNRYVISCEMKDGTIQNVTVNAATEKQAYIMARYKSTVKKTVGKAYLTS